VYSILVANQLYYLVYIYLEVIVLRVVLNISVLDG
jgi:hypothetical protein